MTIFWSCHLIVNRKLIDDRRHVHNFIDADSFHWGGISTLLFKWTLSTNTDIFCRYFAHFREMLNISTATDSTFTVVVARNLQFAHMMP